jgi:hypothetical protein
MHALNVPSRRLVPSSCWPRARPSDEAPQLAALVRDLQQQNLELAGMVGALQQRLLFAEDRIRMLEAPKEPAPSEIAPSGPKATLTVEVAQEPATNGHAHSRPWWRFW